MSPGPVPRPPRAPRLSGSESDSRLEYSEPSFPSGGTYFLGRYRVVDEIGVGGMASVHLARADGPGGFQKWVAIKRIHKHLAEDQTFISMFLDEARIAARITHPNVAQVFDLGTHRDSYWIAMEYLHGEPLREVMRVLDEGGGPPMGHAMVARIVADAAEGLHAAHELADKQGKTLGLVHRDVTPHNLFVTYDGSVKVVDFGVAKVTDRMTKTRAGTLKGKLAYMSPEQVRGEDVDRRTDVFALGVVLWEITTGRRLFRMDNDLDTLERVQACIVPSPSSIVPNYPVELESIVMRALAKDKNRRFQTARELSRALQQYLMKTGQFIGADEIGGYMKQVLADRYEKREAHLQWAAEVTQTISLDKLERPSAGNLDEVSLLTLESDVQSVPGGPLKTSTALASPGTRLPPISAAPAANAPPRRPSQPTRQAIPSSTPVSGPAFAAANAMRPFGATQPLAAPRPAAGRPPTVPPPKELPGYPLEGPSSQPQPDSDMNSPKRTQLGLGAPPPPPPRPAAAKTQVIPSYSAPAAPQPPATQHPGFHSYDEDDDAVTRIMDSPLDLNDEDLNTASISTAVHVPPKSYQPAPQPASPVVVSEPPPAQVVPTPAPPQAQAAAPQVVYSQPPQKDSRSLMIAVIAATTTLAALALTALVVLKVLEKPAAAPVPTVATVQAPTAPTATAPAPTATAETPPPATAAAAPTATAAESETLDPSSLPEEKKPETATGTGSPAPARVPGPLKPQEPAAPKAEPGFLTVVCDPACDSVSANGRNLGPSPVVRASLPPGNYGVSLRRKGAPSKAISVTITSGKTTAQRVSMGS
ncbi:MAG: protein kinase [Myxococcales bacterium]|nr:protein kinase [Myxococcales bacterium]